MVEVCIDILNDIYTGIEVALFAEVLLNLVIAHHEQVIVHDLSGT